jgi:serine/threonine protein kinase/Tol biopolymer transport system component
MTLGAGAKLGPYEIQSPVGAGGMGEVYRARDTRLDRTVAIKILPAHLSSNPEAKQRFEREARAISSLNHPNICTLYDVGHQDGIDYLVMEFLEGETLADRLMRGPLPSDQVLKYGVEICEGLEKAHRGGVTHRDLKPGNIMLTKTGAKLMDFGLAKACSHSGVASSLTLTSPVASRPLTQEGMVIGTFQYMSPEQIEGKEADARSDIFGLGAVLYEMATGKRAFEGKTTTSVIAAILERDPPPVSAVQPMFPRALDGVVKTCLEKDPEERWQSAHDVKLQLKAIATSADPLEVSPTRRNYERLIWITAVALLLMIATAAYLRSPRSAAQPVWSSILAPENTSLAYFTGPVTVSHDGRTLAFVATTSAGKDVVWVRPLDASEARALAGTEGASSPFWSADDRSIGFFAGGKLKTIGAVGGPVVTICDAPLPRGGTWNQNGVILFAITWSGIYRVPSSGGTPAEITKPDASRGETSHRWPYFLPDGQHFLYFTGVSAEVASIHIGALDSAYTKLLFPARSNAAYTSGYILFVRDRMLMAQAFDEKKLQIRGQAFPVAGQVLYDQLLWRGVFSCSSNGILAFQGANNGADSRLIVFDRTGKELRTVGTPGDINGIRISPDGQRLVVVALDSSVANYKLWVYDLLREKETRLTFGSNRDNFPIWAPDGKSLVFASIKNGPYDLFEKRSDTTGSEEPVLQSPAAKNPSDWSRDGRFIAYTSTTPGNPKSAVWILPRFGDRKQYTFLEGDFNIGEAIFSPDGHWLAYSSDETGRSEIYVTPFPRGGSKWEVSTSGGSGPRWRPDGKEIFFLAADSTLMAAEVDPSGSVFQVGVLRPLFHLALRTGAARFDFSGLIGYDAAPDGKSFVVNSPPAGNPPPITLITNWAPEPIK